MTDKPKGPNQFVSDAYSLNDKESIMSFYRKWADEYDHQMQSEGYCSPQGIADLLRQHILHTDLEVLDAGCGTGLTGLHLANSGITALDGLDLSGEMIKVARSRDIYRRLIVADLNQPLPLEDNSYDAVVSSGTFTHGHVGPEPLGEIFRVLRAGGLLACTVHFDLWHNKGFDAVFASLMSQGVIKCVALREGPYYANQDAEGWFCVYQKCE